MSDHHEVVDLNLGSNQTKNGHEVVDLNSGSNQTKKGI